MSFNLLIFSCRTRRASFSIFICDNSAVRAVTVLADREPTFAKGKMEYRAMIFADEVGPRA